MACALLRECLLSNVPLLLPREYETNDQILNELLVVLKCLLFFFRKTFGFKN